MAYDLSTVNVTDRGVQTGAGTFVDPGSLSDAGYAQASNYQKTKDATAASPTVVTDSNIREKVIPTTTGKADSMLGKEAPAAGTTGKDGQSEDKTYGNLTATSSIDDIMKYLGGSDTSTDAYANDPIGQNINNLLAGQKNANEFEYNQTVQDIHNQYNTLRSQLQEGQKSTNAGIDQALAVSGADRYAPVSAAGVVSAKQAYDIQKLSDLASEESGLVAKARAARSDKDFQLLGKQLDLLEKKREEKVDQAKKINQDLIDQNKSIRDNLEAAKNDALSIASKANAPQSVFDAIKNATNPTAAYAATSGYGGSSNNDVVDLGTSTDPHKVLIDKTTGKIIKDLTNSVGGSGGNSNGITPAPADPNSDSAFLLGRTVAQAEAYNKVPDSEKGIIKQLVNGDSLLTDVVKSRGAAAIKDTERIVNEAIAIDPSFSINTNKIRYEFKKDWNDPNGKIGQSRIAINTALGHLAESKKLSSELTPAQLQVINKTANWWNAQTGDPKITNLQFALTQLATEIATAYKGAAPSQEEIESERAALGTQFSKEQFDGVFNTAASLLSSKITSTRYSYKSTMGKEYDQSIIDPDKKAELIKAGIDPKSIAPEKTPGETTVGDKIKAAQAQKYDSASIIRQLLKDPEYGPKIQEALKDPTQNYDTVLNYLANQ